MRTLLRSAPFAGGLRLSAGCAVVGCGLLLAGCGGAVANLLPDAAKPATGVPAGPTLGYVFSAADGTLRALLGVRGSAQVSASIVPAGVYVAGDASMASGTALLEDGTGSLFAFDLPLSEPLHVADTLPLNALVAFAPSGRTALVYAPGAASLLVVSGLPGSPQTAVRAVQGNTLVSAAISDAGTVLIAVQGTPQRVGTVSAAGAFAPLASVAAIGGLSFLPNSDDALIADAGASTATMVHNVSSGATSQALTVAGLNRPLGIAGSNDRRWAVIANGGDQNVLRVDLTGATPAATLGCACRPTTVSALAGGNTFRVNALYAGPLWTVDATPAAAPQLLFVPAIQKGTP